METDLYKGQDADGHCIERFRGLDNKKIEVKVFGKFRNVMEERVKLKWSEKVTNEEVLECVGHKRTLLNNM